MAKTRLRIVRDQITPSLRRVSDDLQKLPNEAYNFFKQETPIKTGNARRRTRLQGEVIKADYDYATALDAGSSRQAPEGMTIPTEQFITKRIKEIMRKK
jgi:hypothetical protein